MRATTLCASPQSAFKASFPPLQDELEAVPAVVALLDSIVAALRAKALIFFALLTKSNLPLLLQACQSRLTTQVADSSEYLQSEAALCSKL